MLGQNILVMMGDTVQFAFKTITPDSGGNIVADDAQDTLTVVGSTGISTSNTTGQLYITNDSPNQVQNTFTNIDGVTAGSATQSIDFIGTDGISVTADNTNKNITFGGSSTSGTSGADGAPGAVQLAFKNVQSDNGVAVADSAIDTLGISGGDDISTSVTGDTVTITNDAPNVDQNVFTTFAISAGSNVTASSTTESVSVIGLSLIHI